MVLQKIGSQAKYLDTAPSSGSEGELWKNFLYATLVLQSISETTSSNTRSFDVNGVADPENATMQLTGVDNGSTETRSGSLAPGGSDSVTIEGDAKPTSASLTISGSKTTRSGTESGSEGSSLALSHDSDVIGLQNTEVTTTSWTYGGSETFDPSTGFDHGYKTLQNGDSRSATVSTSGSEVDSVSVWIITGGDFDLDVKVDGQTLGSISGSSDGWHTAFGSAISTSSTTQITLKRTDTNDEYGIFWGDPDNEYQDKFEISYPGTDSVTFSSSSDSVTIYSNSDTKTLNYDKSETISVSVSGADASYEASYTEIIGVDNPSVSVGSSTVSHNGVLDGSVTETVDLSTGSDTIDASYSGSGLSYNLEWDEHEYPSDPTIQLDGGATTLTHTGTLAEGETASKSVDLTTGTHSASISSNSEVKAEILWDEVQEETNPDFSNPDLQVLNQKLHVYYNGTWVPEQ